MRVRKTTRIGLLSLLVLGMGSGTFFFQNCSKGFEAIDGLEGNSKSGDGSTIGPDGELTGGSRGLDATELEGTSSNSGNSNNPGNPGTPGNPSNPITVAGALNITVPSNYAMGNMLDESQMGNTPLTIVTGNPGGVVNRNQDRNSGSFSFHTNEFKTTELLGNNFTWQMETQIGNGGTVFSFDYDFGFVSERVDAATPYATMAYPELCYGTKRFDPNNLNISQRSDPAAGVALPAPVNNLPNFVINYNYSSTDNPGSGYSHNPGNTLFGQQGPFTQERNVAIESFFHPCGDLINNSVNDKYEIMLWLATGPERAPDGSQSLAGNVMIDGREYQVWSKKRSNSIVQGYIAFIDTNPRSSAQGTINYSLFVDWVRNYGHRLTEVFPGTTALNQPNMNSFGNLCMSNILMGSEIWWGAGRFDLNQWDIRAYEKL